MTIVAATMAIQIYSGNRLEYLLEDLFSRPPVSRPGTGSRQELLLDQSDARVAHPARFEVVAENNDGPNDLNG